MVGEIVTEDLLVSRDGDLLALAGHKVFDPNAETVQARIARIGSNF
jgi:hypothetical protein